MISNMSFIERIFYILQKYGTSYLKGAGTTLVIALVSTFIGCIIGFLSGALGGLLKKSRILLFLHGGLCGILFSLLMDLWSMVWLAGEASLGTWLALVATALPMTVTYAVSNILFLALLAGPIGRKLVRMQVRYGFFAVSAGE